MRKVGAQLFLMPGKNRLIAVEPNGMPFESGTYDQIKTIGRLTRNVKGDPLAAAMALMPDAHPGYGMPIGGVVALYNAVSPNFVGVDIACRMTGSTWQLAKANVAKAIEAIKKIGRFGFDANEGRDAQDHPVMHDPLWNELPVLRGLKAKAQAQLGTSGSGNSAGKPREIVLEEERCLRLVASSTRTCTVLRWQMGTCGTKIEIVGVWQLRLVDGTTR